MWDYGVGEDDEIRGCGFRVLGKTGDDEMWWGRRTTMRCGGLGF